MPAWYWSISDGADVAVFHIDTIWEALAVVPIGAIALPLGVRLLNLIATGYAALAKVLLSSSPDPELTARVDDLRDSRVRIIELADAERRRLERDPPRRRAAAAGLALAQPGDGPQAPGGRRPGRRRPARLLADDERARRWPSCATSRAASIRRS